MPQTGEGERMGAMAVGERRVAWLAWTSFGLTTESEAEQQ